MSIELFGLMTMNDWIIFLVAFGGWTAVWAAIAGFAFASVKDIWLEAFGMSFLVAALWIVVYLMFTCLVLDPLFRTLARG